MKFVSIRRGYSAARKIGDYEIASHAFEIFKAGEREIRIVAGRCAYGQTVFVGTISEGTKIHRTVVDPHGTDIDAMFKKLVALAEEIIK